MSGNIHDTNVELLKTQVQQLVNDIHDIKNKNENPQEYARTLSKRYKELSKTSTSLFSFIIDNGGSDSFNKEFFDKTINIMFDKILDIQHSETTQHEASQNVGTHLAKQFFPK